MKLGSYVEISTTVEDEAAAMDFYHRLGFQSAGYSVLTDGSINLNLAPAGVPAPLLRYGESDVESVAALDIGVQMTDRGIALFTTPEHLHVMLSPYNSRVPMPVGMPISRCGKFGEYAMPVADTQAAIDYWERLGFKTLHREEQPYPFAILSDEMLVIGLHQTDDFSEPHLTYFAPDMAERIAALQADGFEITPVPPEVDGQVVNAAMRGPGGERFFLFQGQL